MNIISTICLLFLMFSLNGQDVLPSNKSSVVVNDETCDCQYSDYYSFHGADSLGKVYFAIDNNRYRAKKKYKGNNFLYFNVNGQWKKLKGHGKFKGQTSNPLNAFSSEHFEFRYNDNQLLSIHSPSNALHIEISEPLKTVGEYGGKGILFDISATKATLKFQNRKIEGNLISERLIDSVGLKTFSNILKAVFGGFKFDGYYLNVEGFGDLYIHLVESKATIGFKNNIYNLNSEQETKDFELTWADYKVTKSKRVGFKKLPLEVEIDLPEAKLKLRTTHFQKYRNLLVFAFGMGVVEGELIYNGNSYTVYGLSELFEF